MKGIQKTEAALKRLYIQKNTAEAKKAEIDAEFDRQIGSLNSQINELEKAKRDLEKLFAQQEAVMRKAEEQISGKKKESPAEEPKPVE